jgi:hypothetical protein
LSRNVSAAAATDGDDDYGVRARAAALLQRVLHEFVVSSWSLFCSSFLLFSFLASFFPLAVQDRRL